MRLFSMQTKEPRTIRGFGVCRELEDESIFWRREGGPVHRLCSIHVIWLFIFKFLRSFLPLFDPQNSISSVLGWKKLALSGWMERDFTTTIFCFPFSCACLLWFGSKEDGNLQLLEDGGGLLKSLQNQCNLLERRWDIRTSINLLICCEHFIKYHKSWPFISSVRGRQKKFRLEELARKRERGRECFLATSVVGFDHASPTQPFNYVHTRCYTQSGTQAYF